MGREWPISSLFQGWDGGNRALLGRHLVGHRSALVGRTCSGNRTDAAPVQLTPTGISVERRYASPAVDSTRILTERRFKTYEAASPDGH